MPGLRSHDWLAAEVGVGARQSVLVTTVALPLPQERVHHQGARGGMMERELYFYFILLSIQNIIIVLPDALLL